MLCATIGAPVHAQPSLLSPLDQKLYAEAFSAAKGGDFKTMSARVGEITDHSLLGYLEFQKLFHPSQHEASFSELKTWLDSYADLPVAQRVWQLAKKRKPAGEADPPKPQASALTDAKIAELPADPTADVPAPSAVNPTPAQKQARSAFNNGQFEDGLKLASAAGDAWVYGLCAYRLGRFDDAARAFEKVALDPANDAWVRAGGGFWAARARQNTGDVERSNLDLRLAAAYPFTFYGLIAERRLGVEPAAARAARGQEPVFAPILAEPKAVDLETEDMQAWLVSDPRARRAMGLVEVGQRFEAGLELKAAAEFTATDAAKQRWLSLARSLDAPLSTYRTAGRAFNPAAYPMPSFSPKGGFKMDRALLFALTRKESKFNPKAQSYAGAYGLMQLMPSTAAIVENDPKFHKKPTKLLDPAINLKVGQDYLSKLSKCGAVQNDLLRLVASYNSGTLPVGQTAAALKDADALLVLESVPVAQTRQYVQEVVAAYWIYRHMLGVESPTLNAAASGARTLDITSDPKSPAKPIAKPAFSDAPAQTASVRDGAMVGAAGG